MIFPSIDKIRALCDCRTADHSIPRVLVSGGGYSDKQNPLSGLDSLLQTSGPKNVALPSGHRYLSCCVTRRILNFVSFHLLPASEHQRSSRPQTCGFHICLVDERGRRSPHCVRLKKLSDEPFKGSTPINLITKQHFHCFWQILSNYQLVNACFIVLFRTPASPKLNSLP